MTYEAYSVSIYTLGCRVNQYESDVIVSELKKHHIRIVPFGENADLSIINTCTVTAESDRKSRQIIRRAANFANRVVVIGCYAQIEGQAASTLPKVEYVSGNGGKGVLISTILSLLDGSYNGPVCSITPPEDQATADMVLTSPQRTRPYIKIEDGCNNRCAYCLINRARGPVRSKSTNTILAEANALAEQGAQEIILTGIETASYGLDFETRRPYGYHLADLLEKVSQIDGIKRIGLGSLEPTVMSDYFTRKVSSLPKVLPHFHLSIQSGSSHILALMRRRYNADMALAAIERMRLARPEVTFSADIITGFPGETEENFEETLSFCRSVRFLHLHLFPYSQRVGTEAVSLPDQIPENIKKERLVILKAEDENIRHGLLNDYVEKHQAEPVNLLVEKCRGGFSSGHSEHFVEVQKVPVRAEIGTIVPVLITGTDGKTVFGKPYTP